MATNCKILLQETFLESKRGLRIIVTTKFYCLQLDILRINSIV